MSQERISSTGLSADQLAANPRPSPDAFGTDGTGPSAVSSAHTTTTVHPEEDVTVSGPLPEPAIVAIGGQPAPTTTQAAGAAVPSVPIPPARAFLPRRPLTRNEAITSIMAIAAWVILTAAGVAVSTKPYIDLLSSASGKATLLELAGAWFVMITCYTFTNIALLCCLSAVIGAIGRSARVDDIQRDDPATDLRTLCITGMIRGFFMFVVILSGTLILSDQKYDDITIEQYLKLAGLVSLLSFAIGYDPHLFVAFFERVSQWTSNVPSQPVRR